jgi:hypothetical protein
VRSIPTPKEITMANDDRNLELLALIHSLQVTSKKAQEIMGHAITVSKDAGFFPMTYETAVMTHHLLEVQSKLIASLVEENQYIRDHVAEFINNLESQ